jgi:hypothetical protein
VAVGLLLVSSLRQSFERASLPAITWLGGLPRAVPPLLVVGLVIAGFLVPGWGWALVLVVALLLGWMLALAWPRLTLAERMMRLAVVAVMVAITVTQAVPRG